MIFKPQFSLIKRLLLWLKLICEALVVILGIYYVVILFKRPQTGDNQRRKFFTKLIFLGSFCLTVGESLFEDHVYFLLELKEETVNGHYCGLYVKMLRTFKRLWNSFSNDEFYFLFIIICFLCYNVLKPS